MKTASTSFLPVLATMSLFLDLAPSVRADAATNAFVTIRAVVSDVKRVDGRNFAASEDGEIEIDAQPGWTLLTPSRVRVTKNQSPRYRVRSVSNEDEGEGDVWRTVVEVVTNHLSDPVIAASVSAEGPYVYALPDDGADAAATFAASIKKLGIHETETRTTTYCNGVVVDESVEKSKPFTLDVDRWSWDWTFEESGTTNRQTFTTPVQHLTNGVHTARGIVEGHSSRCAACSATASVSTNVIVSLLKVACNPWIGQDRTGDPSLPYESPKVTATASLDPENPDVKKVTWGGVNKCEKCDPKDWTTTLWTEDREKASDTYLGETITASVAGATATTNFTIVFADVTIRAIGENNEESLGAFAVCRSASAALPANNAISTLPVVAFSVLPIDLPPTQKCLINCFSDDTLYLVLDSGGNKQLIHPPRNEYAANELPGLDFRLCPRSSSSRPRCEHLSVSHLESGSGDWACFTAVELTHDVRALAKQDGNPSRTKLGVGEIVDLGVLPHISGVRWRGQNGVAQPLGAGSWEYYAPPFATTDRARAIFPDGGYSSIDFVIVEPDSYQIDSVSPLSFVPGTIGAGEAFALDMTPLDVSFGMVEMIEVAAVATNATGWIRIVAQSFPSILDHGQNGAGQWVHVADNNDMGTDTALFELDSSALASLPPLDFGFCTWPIPAKWRVVGDIVEHPFPWSDQNFSIIPSGRIAVQKFGYVASRSPSETASRISQPQP